MLIDDFSGQDLTSKLGTQWRGVSDKVMGGISEASVAQGVIDDRPCLLLTADVRLENDGGFIQAALDLAMPGCTFDASASSFVAMTSDTRFTSARRKMSVLGSPTELISPQRRTGRQSIFLSQLSLPIGSIRLWISTGFGVLAWAPLGAPLMPIYWSQRSASLASCG